MAGSLSKDELAYFSNQFDTVPKENCSVSRLNRPFKDFVCKFVADQMKQFLSELPGNKLENQKKKFKQFFSQLPGKELEEDKIDELSEKYKDDIYEICFQGIRRWCDQNSDVKWEDVSTIVEGFDLIDEYKASIRRMIQEKRENKRKEKFAPAIDELEKIYQTRHSSIQCLRHDVLASDLLHIDSRYDVAPEIHSDDGSKQTEDNFFEKENDRFVILSGPGGIGKTTSLQLSLIKWVDKILWKKFFFVFYVSCKEVNCLPKECGSLKDLLECLYPAVMEKVTFATLGEIADRILFIVDGFNEFKYLEQLLAMRRGDVCLEPIVHVMCNIIRSDVVLVNHSSLIAGRNDTAVKIKRRFLDCCPKFCNVGGLNMENRKKFIKKRVGNNGELELQIICFIDHPTNLMATVPVFLEVICSYFKVCNDGRNYTSRGMVMTEICIWAVVLYIQNHFKGNGECSFIDMPICEVLCEKEVMEMLSFVCKMAFEMLKKGCNVMTSRSPIKIPGGGRLEDWGFISKPNVSQLRHVYEFLHPSLMEFLAAIHIIIIYQNDSLNSTHKESLKGCEQIVLALRSATAFDSDAPEIVKMFVKAVRLKFEICDC